MKCSLNRDSQGKKIETVRSLELHLGNSAIADRLHNTLKSAVEVQLFSTFNIE